MATKDIDSFLGDGQKLINNGSSSNQHDRYSNLNLNANHGCPTSDRFHSKNDSSGLKSTKNYYASIKGSDNFSGENDDRKKVDSSGNKVDNGFRSNASNNLNNYYSKEDVKDQKRWKNGDTSLKNNSTLSLHIETYENSVEVENCLSNSNEAFKAKSKMDKLEKALKDVKQVLLGSNSKNVFEIPRQQEEASPDPEITQFRASQRLLNPNSNSNDGEHVSETNVDRAVKIVKHVSEGQFKVNEKELEKIYMDERVADLPLIVLCIAGPARSGKSFLMNFFLDYLYHKEKYPNEPWELNANTLVNGFEFRNGSDPTTLGIWAWNHIFVIEKDGKKVAVSLIDSQGTFDKNTNYGDCSTIFSMASLFSSCVCFNVFNNLQEDKLNDLLTFINHGASIFDNLGESGKLFQDLVFIIRDFSYDDFFQSKDGGLEYVESVLGSSSLQQKRKDINATYERLHGFILPHPGEAVARRNTSNIAEINTEFLERAKDMVESLFSQPALHVKCVERKDICCKDIGDYIKSCVKCCNDNQGFAPQAVTLNRDFLINLEVDRVMKMYESWMDEILSKCKCGYDNENLVVIHGSIVGQLVNDIKKHLKNKVCDEVIQKFVKRTDEYFDIYKKQNEKLGKKEHAQGNILKKIFIGVVTFLTAIAVVTKGFSAIKEITERVCLYWTNLATLDKERAEAEALMAKIYAESAEKKMAHERFMEYLKIIYSGISVAGNIFGLINVSSYFKDTKKEDSESGQNNALPP